MNYNIFTLYQKCKAVKFATRGFVIGSNNSRYSTSSHVMATHPRHREERPHLARIEFFAKSNIQHLSNDTLVTCFYKS